MKQRGRISRAALEIVTPHNVEALSRPMPPEHLTDEQASEWVMVVNDNAAEHFRPGTHGLLSDYCKHIVRGRHIAQLIDAEMETGAVVDIDRMDKLFKMAERESRAASSLATRLRITPQSTVSPKAKKPPMLAARPWE